MIKNAKCHIEVGSECGANPVRLRYGAASIKAKCSISQLLGAKFKQYLVNLEQQQSGATIIIKGSRTEAVLKELSK